jgi:hypothetical protein
VNHIVKVPSHAETTRDTTAMVMVYVARIPRLIHSADGAVKGEVTNVLSGSNGVVTPKERYNRSTSDGIASALHENGLAARKER